MSVRVVHVSQPVTAGVAAAVVHLVREQVGRGWDVHVVSPSGELAFRATSVGATTHSWRATRSPGLATLAEVHQLQRILRRLEPDLVHLHSSKAGLVGRLALRGATPTIFQPHLWSFQLVDGIFRRAVVMWERLGARWTHQLLCVSEDELAVGRAAGIHSAAVVIPNGIDTSRLLPADRAATRLRYDLSDSPTAVCLGRFAPQKGQDLLLSAWPTVLAMEPRARLILVGDGPSEQDWRERHPVATHPSVAWVGSTDRPADWYAIADVVVLPSRAEGMAFVPLEAMSAARPVVAFDVGGVRKTLGIGTGEVVPFGDLDGLAKAIVVRLVNPAMAAREGERGRERVANEFDAAVNSKLVAEVVADMITAGIRQ